MSNQPQEALVSLSDDLQGVAQCAARLSLRAAQIHRAPAPLPPEAITAIRGEAALLRAALALLESTLAIHAPTLDPGRLGPLYHLREPDPHIDLGEPMP